MVTCSGLRQLARSQQSLSDAGVEAGLAENLAALEFIFPALDLVDLAQSTGSELKPQPAPASVSTPNSAPHRLARSNQSPANRHAMANPSPRQRPRRRLLHRQPSHPQPALRKESITAWRTQHEQAIAKLNQLLTTITTQGADLAPVSVALRSCVGWGEVV